MWFLKKAAGQFLKKLNVKLLNDLEMLLLGMHPRKIKTNTQTTGE